jgi:hypothetical protein
MLEKRKNQPPFSAVLLERNGRYYFFDSLSSVIASGDTVAQAYEKFTAVQVDQFGEFERAGLGQPGVAGRAGDAATRPGFGRELGLFIAKFCLALLIIAAFGLPVVAGIARGIEAAVSAATASIHPISLADIADKAADVAGDAQRLTPEKKESLRRSIGIIKRELGPVVDALSEPSQPQPASNR